MRVVALVLVVAIYFAIVASHQLTPYVVLAGVGGLTVLDLVRPRWMLALGPPSFSTVRATWGSIQSPTARLRLRAGLARRSVILRAL